MNKLHPPTEIDLLIGRIVVTEEFTKKGWIGIGIPDLSGHHSLIGPFTGQDLRRYVGSLFTTYGEDLRDQIATYSPPSHHRIYFVGESEATSKDEVRSLILSAMRT